MAGEAGGKRTVEHVDTACHRLDDADRVTESHEVAGLVERQDPHAGVETVHLASVLTHTEAADCIAVEADVGDLSSGPFPQSFVGATLHDSEL